MTDDGRYMATPTCYNRWPYGHVVANDHGSKGQHWLLDADSGLKVTLDELPDQARVRIHTTKTTDPNYDIMSPDYTIIPDQKCR